MTAMPPESPKGPLLRRPPSSVQHRSLRMRPCLPYSERDFFCLLGTLTSQSGGVEVCATKGFCQTWEEAREVLHCLGVFKFRAGGGDCCSKARRCSGEYGPPLSWKRLERARRCVFGISGHVLMLGLGGPKASLVNSDGKASACNAGDPGLIPVLGRVPWRRKWQPSPVSLPGKPHG